MRHEAAERIHYRHQPFALCAPRQLAFFQAPVDLLFEPFSQRHKTLLFGHWAGQRQNVLRRPQQQHKEFLTPFNVNEFFGEIPNALQLADQRVGKG